MDAKKLTPKQAAFVQLYDGNGTEAARRAGYKGSDNTLAQTARDLLRNPQIQKGIGARNNKALAPDIADRQERQSFWTKTLRNEDIEMKERLKASELLGKSEADFTEKHEHRHSFDDLTDEQLEARFLALLTKVAP